MSSKKLLLLFSLFLFSTSLFFVYRIKRESFKKSSAGYIEGDPSSFTNWGGNPPPPDGIIIKFKDSATASYRDSIPSKFGYANTVKIMSFDHRIVIKDIPADQIDSMLQLLSKEDNIEYAEPDYRYRFFYIPNDPKFQSQWWLPKIKAPDAWDVKKGSKSVLVAIVDSGVYTGHSDLKDNVVLTRESQNDTVGHGTHLAGIVSAVTDNAKGIAGTGFNVGLIAVDIDADGKKAGGISASDAAEGITWAADNGAKVINMSFGGSQDSQTMRGAVAYAWSKGVVLTAAAGNDGNSKINYPASYPNVISVAATDQSDKMASFSTYGSWVTIAAPGVAILSTFKDGSYFSADGTSMAAPVVAGVAALIISANPGMTNQQVVNTLCQSADDIAGTGTRWSCGRVNAFKALGGAVPSPTASSSPSSPPTLPPAGGLKIKVRFQGIDEKGRDQSIKLQILRDGSSIFTNGVTGQSDERGLYTLSLGNQIPAGTYDLKIKGTSSLQRKIQNIVYLGGDQTIDLTKSESQILRAGDVSGDNKTTIADISQVLRYYTKFSVPVGSDPTMEASDINKDGTITIQDVALIAINWSDFAVSGDN